MRPVTAPEIPTTSEGFNALVSIADHRVALATANRRLTATRKWYDGVRAGYARAK